MVNPRARCPYPAADAGRTVPGRASRTRSSTRRRFSSSPAMIRVRYPPQASHSKRLGATCDCAPQLRQLDGHLRRVHRQGSVGRTTSGARGLECPGEQRCVDAGQWTHFHHDALDRLSALLSRNGGDLRQKRLADGQLVHRADATAGPSAEYVRNRTDRMARSLLSSRSTQWGAHGDVRACTRKRRTASGEGARRGTPQPGARIR